VTEKWENAFHLVGKRRKVRTLNGLLPQEEFKTRDLEKKVKELHAQVEEQARLE